MPRKPKPKPIPRSVPGRWLPSEMPKVWTAKDKKKDTSRKACRGRVDRSNEV